MAICEKLQQKLNLKENAFEAQHELWKEGDTDGNFMISRSELITWVLDYRRDSLNLSSPKPALKIETEEAMIARIIELFIKCDVDKSGKLRNSERVDLVKALQSELDLAKNPWAAQT